MLIGKKNVIRKVFKNIQTIEIACSGVEPITVQQAIIIYP
jgi:hypothetical protein